MVYNFRFEINFENDMVKYDIFYKINRGLERLNDLQRLEKLFVQWWE